VRYEIRMNKPLFDTIVANKWYNGQVQAEADSIDFPVGAMLIKAAWREFSPEQVQEVGDRFLTRETCFCESPEMKSCHVATAALVGLHVMHKTPSAPQWIWETFEHVANVQPSHGLPASFFNPECTGDHCTPNSQTYTPTPNQVTRLLPIADSDPDCSVTTAAVDNVVQLNADVMKVFAKSGSVLANYQLVSAQWPMQRPDLGSVDTVFSVLPTHSANTTMESFAQETSSCMGCHVMSRSLKPDVFVSGDFSFTLNNARPFPEGAVCSKYGDSNSESCDDRMIIFDGINNGNYTQEQWQQIKRGYLLSEHTYEMIPKPYVNNRLHCGSCHLHAGGDPDAAWWVDMDQYYSPVEKLQARINSCFNHSMNGQSICEPASDGNPGTCNTNQDMNAMIAYMGWLTDTYHAERTEKPPRGYPPMQSQPQGDPQRGAEIFAQKCAFCHNADGQGRYESDTYFRPALWGDDSYNASAGMSTPSTFAAFIKSNMPYGSGGLLTDQEAMDIGCFVDAQLRPGKSAGGDQTADSDSCLKTE
jgi:cytochrome c